MPSGGSPTDAAPSRHRRRWLLGLEPIFEGGWLHKGRRARAWDVEDELIAVSLLGDVSVDLSAARSVPARVEVRAWAILRDVDVTVPAGTHVELTGRSIFGRFRDESPAVPPQERGHVVRVGGWALAPISDVTVRAAG